MEDLKIGNWRPVPGVSGQTPEAKKQAGFEAAIQKAVDKTRKLEHQADQSIMNLLSGEGDIHESMIALQKLDLSMRLLLTVRNKAIEAYKEITHMQF